MKTSPREAPGPDGTTLVTLEIPLDAPACTVCGAITMNLDGEIVPCSEHPQAPLARRTKK